MATPPKNNVLSISRAASKNGHPGSNREQFIPAYITRLQEALGKLPEKDLSDILALLETAYEQGRSLFLAGNGGSASTAAHLANDLLAGVAKNASRGFKVVSLCDNTAVMTCLANDYGYDEIFSRQLRELASPGDVFIAISGSGNSPNILAALEEANTLDMRCIALLGKTGGKASDMAEISLVTPSDDYGIIEDTHMAVSHLLAAYLRGWAAVVRPKRG